MTDQEKTDWVAALRSGEYKQAVNSLYRNFPEPTYCCLGVKLEITGNHVLLTGETYELCPVLGMSVEATKYFAFLNDNYQLSFDEIALVIENVPEEQWVRCGHWELGSAQGMPWK